MIPAYIINAIKQKENEKQNEIHVGSVGIYRYPDMSDSSDAEMILTMMTM